MCVWVRLHSLVQKMHMKKMPEKKRLINSISVSLIYYRFSYFFSSYFYTKCQPTLAIVRIYWFLFNRSRNANAASNDRKPKYTCNFALLKNWKIVESGKNGSLLSLVGWYHAKVILNTFPIQKCIYFFFLLKTVNNICMWLPLPERCTHRN